MDTLRNALEIVFKEMMVGPLLKDAPRSPFFDAERFARILQRHSLDLSLDQCRLSARMVEQYYMIQPTGSAGRNCGSVFNVLLHFSREVLREYEGRPVCKFEHLLRWNAISSLIGEDLLTTSFLASKDLRNNYKRHDFDWGLVIEQDDPDLRELFHNKMADVHMHLKGSSCNFDLNWLSLMNHPGGRSKEFRGLESLRHPLRIMNSTENVKFSLQTLATKACAIRYLLYKKYVCVVPKSEEKSLLVSMIKAGNDVSTVIYTRKLEVYLAAERMCANPHRTGLDHDYIWQVDENAVKRNPNCIVAGERRLLYECFRAVYSGEMTEYDCQLLHAYILIKNIIRNELIQTNDVVGFDNFNSYEIRKTLFIDNYPVYERLVAPLAIGQYFYKGLDRYVEPRITPKDSAKNLQKSIAGLDRDLKCMSLADKDRDYKYILHFIKQRDVRLVKPEPMNPRHHELRKLVRRQTYAIYNFCQHSRLRNRVVGIDAANSEINARPEVFAQAFRLLRDMRIHQEDVNSTSSLGLTYHAGEDFLSIIDGLRAIDEVRHFLCFRRGDRIGHALVLCIDPERYLHSRHDTLLLPKMLVLDDIAWALNKSEDGTCLAALRIPLENIFYRVFREVYGVQSISIRDYYESWLLRGDNPSRYNNIDVDLSDKVSLWSRYDLNNDSEAIAARKNPDACNLYRCYHYDLNVRTRGEKVMELRCPEGTAQLIADLQGHVIRQIENRNIGIETNPTSNVRIGGFGRYIDHTAMKFLSIDGLQTHLSASINTDDRGVFATSLEREYALLACAIAKGNEGEPSRSMSEICMWLDRIRRNGLAQRF